VMLALAMPARPAHADLGLTADTAQASLVTWWPTVHGTLGAQLGSTGSAGITYDEGAHGIFGATAAFRTYGALCLDLDFTPIRTDATVVSHAAFSFRNQTFATTGAGHLTYDLPIFGMGLRYLVLDGKQGNLGVIGAIKITEPDVTLALGGVSASFRMTLPVPMAGLAGQYNIGEHGQLFGSFKLFHLDVASVTAHVENWEAGAAWQQQLSKAYALRGGLGYRELDVDLSSGSANDLRLSTRRGGPFAELALTF